LRLSRALLRESDDSFIVCLPQLVFRHTPTVDRELENTNKVLKRLSVLQE